MRVLFVDDDGAEPTWLLTQAGHQHQGTKSPMRTGTHLFREDFGERNHSHMGKDMHATSRIEIAVSFSGNNDAAHLVILTARLCDQAIAWDHRTVRAAPLHFGMAADKDHPQYGDREPDAGEADEDEPSDDDDR